MSRPATAVHVMLGHSRWTAAAREMARQHWGNDAGLTLIMTSLGALGALFFRGGMLAKVVTAYSGNSFPSYAPNPIFKAAYESGEVDGRALVDPDHGPAPGGGGPGPPGRRSPAPSPGRTWPPTVPSRPSTPPSVRWACWLRWSRTWPCCMPPWPTARATWPSPSPCSRGRGGRGRPVGASWPRWSRSSTTSMGSATGSAFPPTGSWPWSRRPSAPIPGGCYAPGLPAGRLRRGHPLLDRRRRAPPGGLRRLGPEAPTGPAGPRRLPAAARWTTAWIGLRRLSDPDRGAGMPRPTRFP